MEVDKGTMTVVGRFDAKKLRDRVAKKKVHLLLANKNKNKGNEPNKLSAGERRRQGEAPREKSKEQEDQKKKKGKDGKPCGGGGDKGKGGKDSKKPIVPVVGTVVLKIGAVGLHCDGRTARIRTKLFHIDGVEQLVMEMAKNQVTVTGTMDIKALPEKLRRKLRRPVDVVQPNKQKQQDGKDKDKDCNNKQDGKDAAAEKEAWKAAFYDQQAPLSTEFMFSDENPDACSIT